MNTITAGPIGAGDNIAGPVRVGDLVADKYLVERTLGIGGMGVVVAARDQVLDRRVAIKFLLPKLAGSDTAVQRFVREARAASRISSEHVVRLLEIEKLPSGTPFFVMEHLEGCDLRTLLRERGPLAPSLAVDYALQALQAVAEGHVRGIVHRDIKPGNLFLAHRADGTPLIKVLDFGIAKTAESDAAESTSLTSSDDVRLGSPAYMPPEQLQNPRDVDTRSDIWSLGATLYELLCGRPPFEGPGYLELATHVLNRPPLPLSKQALPGPLPNGLEQVLSRCLEKERDARYANAAELATALAPFGSADARISLSRVSGMFASSSSLPAFSRAIVNDNTDCDPTLDVAGSAQKRRPLSGEPGPAPSAPARSQRHSWLVIGAAAILVLGVVALRDPFGRQQSPVARPPVALAVPAQAQAQAAEPAPLPASSAVVASAETAAPAVAEPKRVHKHVDKSPRRVAVPVAPAPTEPVALPTVPSVNVPGRSAEIERLIEQRH